MGGQFEFKLNAKEALLLSSVERPEVAKIVAQARAVVEMETCGLSENERAMVAKIVSVATEKGRLTLSRTNISVCPCCGRKEGYFVYPRAGKYHRKGAPNYSKPKLFIGWNLDQGFVSVQNYFSTGFCDECRPRVEPVLLQMLDGIRAEFPKHWEAAPHKFRRYDNRTCTKCGWSGHDGQMRPSRTLMGGGFYPGGCPNCDAENRPLGQTLIKQREGFTVVEVPTTQGEKTNDGD